MLFTMIIYKTASLFYTFVPENAFGQLLSSQPKALIQSKTTDSVFDHIEINPLQIEDSVSVTLLIQNKF